MFTGIVQGVASVQTLVDRPGLRSLRLRFPDGFAGGLEVGASVAVDGVCLTVTALTEKDAADFDVMQQSLVSTTLDELGTGSRVNVERAARDGAEIGGHPLSGHIDVRGRIAELQRPDNNHVLRIAVPAPWMRYVFAKGYVAVDGASLTVAQARREAGGGGSFEVWLIPETLRMTTFGDKSAGDAVNIEIDRSTQVIVDTVRDAVNAGLGHAGDWAQVQALITSRRHVAPKRLVAPGPDDAQLQCLLTLAAAAPDHGELTPWRFIIVPPEQRRRLGEAFGKALLDRDPNATAQQVADAADKAQRAPLVMLAVARLGIEAPQIPPVERLVSLGCAIQNILLGAQALGFGSGLTSGRAMSSPHLAALLDLEPGEVPVCCVNIGSVAQAQRRARARPAPADFTRSLE